MNGSRERRLSAGDIAYAANLAIACLISYWTMRTTLAGIADEASVPLGGMWSAVATVFVFRQTRANSLAAGMARLLATCVSFALCLGYLLLLPATPLGMAVLIGLGTVAMMALGRRDDIITTGITTVVVMVVAERSQSDAWLQPVLRFLDTVVGIACRWAGAVLIRRHVSALAAAPGPSS